MSFFGMLAAGGAEGLAQGVSKEMDYQERLDRERQLQAQRSQDKMDQISLMAALKEPAGGRGSKDFNVIERLMSAKSPEEQDQLIRLVQAGSGGQDASDALFDAVGRPRMQTVSTPTTGDVARYDRTLDENGQSAASVPTAVTQRAQYSRDAGARALQQVLATFADPAKLKNVVDAQGQDMVNTQVRKAIENGSDGDLRAANAAALAINGKDRFGATGSVVVDKAGVAPPELMANKDKPPTGYRWTGDGNLEAIPGGPGDKKPANKPLPSALIKGLLDNQVNLRRAQTALALVNGETVDGLAGDPNATGVKGVLPNTVLNRVDPKGVDTRAAIADLGSLVIHDRSGAAVTASEFPRLAPFIPTASDDAETVKKKLIQFNRNYEAIVNDAADFYRASGYNVPQEVLRSGKADNNTAIPRVASPADLAKIPSGSVFLAPDGKTRRKP